jgi:tricarballylate dehydrogenase
MHYSAARKLGVEVVYETKMLNLLQDSNGAVNGVRVRDKDGVQDLHAKGVILACGGFEANQEMRLKYLGGPWERAKVRGSKYNTGDGHRAALELGAKVSGQWTGCHATPIDVDAPDTGSPDSVDRLPRRSYPFGIMINLNGQRFVDEGEDFALHNFVEIGRSILEQPQGLAFQIFDGKTTSLLEPRYGSASPTKANTIEELAQKLGLKPQVVARTVEEFNAAAQDGPFDPKKLDGKGTQGLSPPKSNWALPIDTPPFLAYKVTGGITYTFGGLKINRMAQVIDTEDNVIPGLYAAGEIVGGFFYFDSLRASGLMHGAVFGRIGGANAAA